MPTFRPFRATRYQQNAGPDIASLVCPPYDVINAAERETLSQMSPHNAVHVEVPKPNDTLTAYQVGAATLNDWLTNGAIATDQEPHLYLYEMLDGADTTSEVVLFRGVIGQLSLEPLDTPTGGVIAHERTTPKDKTDRLTLLSETRTNLSPIWGLSMHQDLAELLNRAAKEVGEYATTVADGGGTIHRVALLDVETSTAIASSISVDPIVIADGHHRYETSLAYHQDSNSPGSDATLCVVCPLDESLRVAAIHRIIRGAPAAQLVDRLSVAFAPIDDKQSDCVIVVAGGVQHHVLPTKAGLAASPFATDAGVLDQWLSDNPDLSVEYTHRVDEVTQLNDGDAIGVVLRPVTSGQIRDAANARTRMPPKSTFYWPKLLTGLVFRRLDDNV